jgi:hypothetical protein
MFLQLIYGSKCIIYEKGQISLHVYVCMYVCTYVIIHT